MNRRSFCTLTAGALVGKPFLNAQSQPSEPTSPLRFTEQITGTVPFVQASPGKSPNIFLISIDMVSPDLYHPDRPLSSHVQIPAIRSLMKDGCFFSNAFCTVPLCSPSRSSYLTGRYSYVL